MKSEPTVNVGPCSKVCLLSLLAIWAHISYAAPNGNIKSSTGSSISDASTAFNPSFASGISRNGKQGIADISRYFPSYVDDKLQKWIELLNSKPKTDWIDDEQCQFDDVDCVEDYDQPAIDLHNGKKPGHLDEAIPLGRQATVTLWPGDDSTVDPILLQRHHMDKKSRYYSPAGLIPKVFRSRLLVDPRRSKLASMFSRFSYRA